VYTTPAVAVGGDVNMYSFGSWTDQLSLPVVPAKASSRPLPSCTKSCPVSHDTALKRVPSAIGPQRFAPVVADTAYRVLLLFTGSWTVKYIRLSLIAG
jgi:hypothetical protein